MPDITIPAALLMTIGVVVSAAFAMKTGDYRSAAVAGVIGTIANLLCFYRRLYIQLKGERERRDSLKQDT